MKALAIQRATLGSMHPDVALTLSDYGGLYLRQNMFAKAEEIFMEAEAIRRKVHSSEITQKYSVIVFSC